MRERNTSSVVYRAVAIGVVLAMVGVGCSSKSPSSTGSTTPSPGDSTGVTSTTITIGSHQPLTGPAAPGYSEISQASNAYFQYVNANGGVNGRSIVYKVEDDGYNPTTTTSVVRKLILQDKVFAIFNGLGTPTHLSVIDYINSQKVPDLFVASGCNCWNQSTKYPETFGWQPDYTIEGKILGQYVKQSLAGKKVGYFYQNDDFGKDGTAGASQEIAATDLVSSQSYTPTNVNIGTSIAALQAAHADVVVSFSIPAFTALALLAAAKLNYHPTWVVSSVGSDPVTLTGLLQAFSKGKAGAVLLNGMVSGAYLPATADASNPWITLFKKIHDQYISKLPFDGNVEYGLAVAYTFVQALKAAGQNPTRESIVAAVNVGLTGPNPGLVPFGYSSTNHLGYLGEQIFTIQNGVANLSGPVFQSTNDGPITTTSQAPSTPSANGIP